MVSEKELQQSTKCVLCNVLMNGVDVTGRKPYILYQNASFIATADVGSMIEGYVLITCKRHINSMGELTEQEYIDFIDIQQVISAGLKNIYNKNCVCFEHGSGQVNQESAASSIKHAHFHMVAIDNFTDLLHKEIITELNMFTIQSQRDLQNYVDKPYILYITGNGEKYISTKEDMESQYMRKKIAEQFGKKWNWKDPETRDCFKENVLATEQKWKDCIAVKIA